MTLKHWGGHDIQRYRAAIAEYYTHETGTSLSMERAMVLVRTARQALRLDGSLEDMDALLEAWLRGAVGGPMTTAQIRDALGFDSTPAGSTDVGCLLDLFGIMERPGGGIRRFRPGQRQGLSLRHSKNARQYQ